MRIGGKLSISGGFGVLLAALLFLDDQNLVSWALFACALHELGHLAAIHICRGHVKAFRLSIVGAEMTPERSRLFSYREELFIAAAGPLMSLGIAAAAACLASHISREEMYLFCGLNLLVGVFNLVPVEPLDGGRILRTLLSARYGTHEADTVCTRVALMMSLILMVGGVLLLLHGGNLTLILTALWLLAGWRRGLG